ncbi:MAG TPA: hypothetical protein VMF52_20720 [Steroidobacteraceae bacterium]|nr:hypothetical protein [Steroidobacteraceae bacterium]
MPDIDDERETFIFHGTTLDVAERIVAQQQFELRETYFAETRELAKYFAIRSLGRRRHQHRPAIIRVTLYESDLRELRGARLVSSEGFGAHDAPELRAKTQLIFTPDGMHHLNVRMFKDELAFEFVNVHN